MNTINTSNDFYYIEVYFLDENGAEITSICIKTKIPPLEFNDDCEIRLKSFLSEDLKILGATNIGDVCYISKELAEDCYDCSNIDNWPMFE